MKGKIIAVCLMVLSAGVTAAEPLTPQRGSALRAELMDRVRVRAATDLGAPIEFVVKELLVDGDHAFANLSAQRPGGVPIDMSNVPMVARLQEGEIIDGPHVVAFLFRQQGRWYVDQYGVGASDVWWWNPALCQPYAKVMPAQACN